MNEKEIISNTKLLFGKNRKPLEKHLRSMEFKGKKRRELNRVFKEVTNHPFQISFGLFDETILAIQKNEKINMDWIGDLSWRNVLLLNDDIKQGYDWDKKLATVCGGTARICEIFISAVLPVFTYDLYYMTYDKTDKWYEFGPISGLSASEKRLVKSLETAMKKKGFTYIGKRLAQKKFKNLVTDTSDTGEATLFDCLFSDTSTYMEEIKRFPEESEYDRVNRCHISWNEFYKPTKKLIHRIAWRMYDTGDALKIESDSKKRITKITVTRKTSGTKSSQFLLDIESRIKKSKK